jgi:hypothetical protein
MREEPTAMINDSSEFLDLRGIHNDRGSRPICYWTGKPEGECGCTTTCPGCGRRRHDHSTPKCYLC